MATGQPISGQSISKSSVFWGEIAPCEHIAQFYTGDSALVETLIGFVSAGLNAGEGVIVIATSEHLSALNRGLVEAGIELPAAIIHDRYIPLEAESALRNFMVDRWPDEHLFADFVAGVIGRASSGGRRVRAFGEMVALLWARGQGGATVRLEHLWGQFCRNYRFSLLCSYPKAGFTKDPGQSLAEICAAHSQTI